ncbi:hypothetical protein F4824DRAFT_473176 [Ustulina deusta]|nr:hypothetical protein F4824DRAFT_473176 [Ustulina deusta]
MIQEENTMRSRILVANNMPRVVIEGNPHMVMPIPRLTREPGWVDCPFCRHITKTCATRQGS